MKLPLLCGRPTVWASPFIVVDIWVEESDDDDDENDGTRRSSKDNEGKHGD